MYTFVSGVLSVLSCGLFIRLLGFGVFAVAVLTIQRMFKP